MNYLLLSFTFLGYLHKIGNEPLYKTFYNLADTYGDIFSVQLGTRLTVVLSSSDAVYEAYVKKSKPFSGRPDLQSFVVSSNGLKGLSLATMTNDYKRNKAMNLRAMQKLVRDKSFVDSILTLEVRKIVNLFDKLILQKNVFYPMEEFGYIVPSVAFSVMFGANYNYNDDQLLSIVANGKEWFETQERW